MNTESPLGRLVAGMAILALGLIIWLDHLHKIHGSDYLRWWSVALIASGIANLVERKWLAAGITIVIGIIFLPHIPFFPYLHPGYIVGLWPLLISFAGMTLVMQALRPAMRDPRATVFRAIAVMGGGGRTIGSNEFVAGDAVAVMGGCEIDLASSSGVREAVIDILVFWGGVEIRIPRGWKVESHVAVILGALVNKALPATAPDAPRLVIRGSVIMGGVEVKNPKEETV